jgi:hypothetical protein
MCIYIHLYLKYTYTYTQNVPVTEYKLLNTDGIETIAEISSPLVVLTAKGLVVQPLNVNRKNPYKCTYIYIYGCVWMYIYTCIYMCVYLRMYECVCISSSLVVLTAKGPVIQPLNVNRNNPCICIGDDDGDDFIVMMIL